MSGGGMFDPFGIGSRREKAKESDKRKAEEQRRIAMEQVKKQREAVEEEKKRSEKKQRYGGRGLPMTDYLGQSQSGVLKTILGA